MTPRGRAQRKGSGRWPDSRSSSTDRLVPVSLRRLGAPERRHFSIARGLSAVGSLGRAVREELVRL